MEIPDLEASLLAKAGPSQVSQRLRTEVFHLLKRNIEKCLSRLRPQLLVYGSWPLQTYTPCGDLDVTIVLPQSAGQSQTASVLATVRSQLEFVAKIRPQCAIRDFTEVNGEVQLLKCSIKGVAVDLSVNQTSGLFSLRLLEYVDSLTAQHLFKRALVVVKAWATYESRVAGSRYGLLASYALSVMVLCVLNCYPETRHSAFQTLIQLLQLLDSLDWEREVVTCFGVLPLADYLASDTIRPRDQAANLFFTPLHLQVLAGDVGGASGFQAKFINIADPLKPENNLGRSVSRGGFERIRLAVHASLLKLEQLGPQSLFPSTLELPSKSEDDTFQFSTELETVQKSLQRALTVPIEPRKQWEAATQAKKVAVAYR